MRKIFIIKTAATNAKGSSFVEGACFISPLKGVLRLHPVGCFFLAAEKKVNSLESHVSIIGIIVENVDSTDRLNELLHEYGSYIIGRMGLPYPKKSVNIISIALDAPTDVINTLAGKIGMLDGISSKVVCSAK